MKKLILLLSFIIIALSSQAQTDAPGAAIPPYRILKTDVPGAAIPPYRILKTDSTWATPANLKHRRTMLIYFAPDCPHCQHLTMDMREKLKQFGDTQIIMITWSNNYDIRAIKNFVRDYDLKKHTNIEIGTEGYSYLVQRYFKIDTTPFVAIYNSQGKLTKAFRKQPEVADLLKAIKVADSKKG